MTGSGSGIIHGTALFIRLARWLPDINSAPFQALQVFVKSRRLPLPVDSMPTTY